MKTRSAPHTGERGFAMLFVFLLAALVAIGIYAELPRVAFEQQRLKEELLIDHGEQYKRGIQLYFKKFRRYPPDLDALEKTNNIRYLRRRFKDPMTGSDEWRLVHAGPGGVLTDSLVQKPGKPGGTKNTGPGQSMEAVAESQQDNTNQQQADQNLPTPGRPRRAADMNTGTVTVPGSDQTEQSESQDVTSDPNAQTDPNVPADPNAPAAEQPPSTQFGAQPAKAGQFGVRPMVPGQPSGPGAPPPDDNANSGAGATNPAIGAIQQQLMGQTVRPGGGSAGMSGSIGLSQQIGAGIAGVATKYEAFGIKVYADRKKYQEWEFVYDPRKDTSTPGANMNFGAQPQSPVQPVQPTTPQ